MTAHVVWRRKDDVAQVGSPGRVAVLDLSHLDRPPLVLEGSAAVIWHLLDGGRDHQDLVRTVAGHFAIAEDEVGPSISTFLEQLRDLELVEPA